MVEQGKSFRIDWFDGTVTENTRPTTSNYLDEEGTKSKQISKLPKSMQIEKKAIGFNRLLELSNLSQPILNLELSNRPGFWLLFKDDLKGDFIVLLVKIIKTVYQSLDAYDTSKIVYLVKDEFEKSDFLCKLKEYLINIPKVRTVNKPRNAFLWDDVESFYFSVLDLCAAIVNLGNNSNGYLKKLYDVLEVAETSAIAVQEEHMEPIKPKFYEELHKLKMKLEQSSRFVWEEMPNQTSSTQELNDKSSFRNLNIFPNKDDLFSNKNVKIEPNIIDGAYPSIISYLDLQFRLLREDLYGPLREGLSKYIENPSKRRFENIRVYPKVRIIKIYAIRNKVGYLIDLAWSERLNLKSVNLSKYARDKWLMCGSLLLFTNDNFDNILFATVLDSSIQLLKEGYILVSFETPLPSQVFSKQYLMVESEVFFEPYHQVLKVLQSLPSNTIPMKRYILDVQKETKLPAYLKPGQIYLTRNDKLEEISFSITSHNWPSENNFGLDKSQMEVFKFALSKEFAVIQGPPGTGKTYMGVKIASTILRNFCLLGTPMLIICYTNHALDQFLEQITKVTPDIVRLGGQGKSQIADLYNINRLRKKVQSKHSYLFAKKRSEVNLVFEEMTKIQTDIDKCENMVLTNDTIKRYLKLNGNIVHLRHSSVFEYEDAVLTWLFGHLHGVNEPEDNNEDWEVHLMPDPTDGINTCFSETYALDKIRSLKDEIKAAKSIPEDQLKGINLVEIYERSTERTQDRLYCLKKYVAKLKSDNKITHKIYNTSDPYKLTTDERWQLYFNTVDVIKDKLVAKLNNVMEKYTKLNGELEEISSILDCELLQHVKVIGVTTTGAARRRDLMTRLKSPVVIVEEAAEVLESHIITSITHSCQHLILIVIVEEAAEVLESHIITSITHSCQHLILIGDHKQLRPSAAHYILAKHYNMDISLFERMIRNGVHARTLTTQHRMRANFVDLLVPIIYETLDCHPTVLEYPPIKGMKDTLFFFDHDVLEDSEESKETWTHKNTFEAKWCVSLANYLRKMEYAENEITILATYNGQASLIQEIAKKYPLLENVNITVVDNYQGEENRIVILSLVRSNKERNIGFLSASNRICVALSRAKEGFYMFGNMKVLRSSPIWRAIHEKLEKQNAIGTELLLKLSEDEETYLSVNNTNELDDLIVEKHKSVR